MNPLCSASTSARNGINANSAYPNTANTHAHRTSTANVWSYRNAPAIHGVNANPSPTVIVATIKYIRSPEMNVVRSAFSSRRPIARAKKRRRRSAQT